MTERQILVAAPIVVALVVSLNLTLSEAPYLLEDREPKRTQVLRWSGAPWLAFERTLHPTKWDTSVEGYRLSKPGEWSLSVGDPVEAFDRYLGMPIHAEPTWPKHNTVTARYKLGEQGGLCVVKVARENGLVTELEIYSGNIWSINAPPLPYPTKEERETPGAWLSLYLPR